MRKTIWPTVILLALSLAVYRNAIYSFGHDVDETFHVKSALVRPQRPPDDPEESMGADYFYSIDHPTLKRHIYRWVLHARGIEAIDIPDFDYDHTLAWNMEQGALPPLEKVVIPLRWANAAFMTAAVIIVYFAAFLLTRAPYWSLFAALPLVFDYRISMGVVAYLGTDAILAFFLALSLLVLIIFDARGIASRPLSVIILGIVGASSPPRSSTAHSCPSPTRFISRSQTEALTASGSPPLLRWCRSWSLSPSTRSSTAAGSTGWQA